MLPRRVKELQQQGWYGKGRHKSSKVRCTPAVLIHELLLPSIGGTSSLPLSLQTLLSCSLPTLTDLRCVIGLQTLTMPFEGLSLPMFKVHDMAGHDMAGLLQEDGLGDADSRSQLQREPSMRSRSSRGMVRARLQ